MHRCGCERDVFSSDGLALMHEASRGHLRDLDRIATACLKLAQQKKLRIVDRDLVVRAQQLVDVG
jgi:general secretion pathway protein A